MTENSPLTAYADLESALQAELAAERPSHTWTLKSAALFGLGLVLIVLLSPLILAGWAVALMVDAFGASTPETSRRAAGPVA